MDKIKLVCISDIHNRHKNIDLPEGDLCVICGDFQTNGYYISELNDIKEWISNVLVNKYQYTILIAGNHDRTLESWGNNFVHDYFESNGLYEKGVRYIQDEEIELIFEKKGKLHLYGSPYQNYFCGWSWNIKDSEKLYMIYEQIPDGLDVLLTHVPPKNILDKSHVKTMRNPTGEEPLGSKELSLRLSEMVNPPRYHVFGHIHGDGGKTITIGNTTYINASICNEEYQPVNSIITLDIEPKGGE